MSMRFQISLPDDLATALRRAAAEEGQPPAQWIQAAIRARLRERKKARRNNPFAGIAGIVDSDQTDLAARVDEILYR